jgi:hypothetical protein
MARDNGELPATNFKIGRSLEHRHVVDRIPLPCDPVMLLQTGQSSANLTDWILMLQQETTPVDIGDTNVAGS